MEPDRFDRWTARLAAPKPRRLAIAGALGRVLTAIAPIAEAPAAESARCRFNGAPCRKRRECCSGRCQRGECWCVKKGKRCDHPKDCCSEVCDRGVCR